MKPKCVYKNTSRILPNTTINTKVEEKIKLRISCKIILFFETRAFQGIITKYAAVLVSPLLTEHKLV